MLMIRNGGLVIKDVWGYEVWLKLSFGNIKIELGCAPRTVDRKLKIVLVITFEP